jgi:thiamine-phosphate pyrophosphorylase
VTVLPETPIIYCISEGRARGHNFQEIKADITAKIASAADRGVHLFQIREKQLSAAGLFELAREAVNASAGTLVQVLVNGRADIALAAGAAGVHLPSDGLRPAELRNHVPSGFIIGVSTHSDDEVAAARDQGADFAVFGPVFASPGKGNAVGLELLRAAIPLAGPMPVLALGGIDEVRSAEVLAAGASGWAAIRYLNELLEREG